MNRPRIAIVCPRLQLPDAVGYDVLHQSRVFSEAGYPVRIFAESWSPETPACRLDDVTGWLRSPRDILIYHYSVHAPRIFEILKGCDCRRVLRYHNVTPAEYIQPYDRAFASALRAGRDFLAAHVATGVVLALADSDENARDLIAAGASRDICAVLPPFHRVPELLDGEADPDWIRQLQPGPLGGAPIRNLLMVGRLVPNKGYEHLIRGFAAMSDRRTRLILAGAHDPRMHLYYRELRSILEELGVVSRVWIPGAVSLAGLRALYRRADLLVVTSEHEGFCLPLIEAM
ncbi:MAG: glycosyltransferase family 4 protein, partial [Leptospirales bacterium]